LFIDFVQWLGSVTKGREIGMRDDGVPRRTICDAVVDHRALAADSASVDDIIPTEPDLSLYVRGEIFKIVGKLGLVGAESSVLRGAAIDLIYLLGVTAAAMRYGYLALLDDFMPQDIGDISTAEPSPSPLPSEAENDTNDYEEGEAGIPH
jgi:hypothetical protein